MNLNQEFEPGNLSKLEFATYLEARGFQVPKRFGGIREATAFLASGKPIIIRSEHPQDSTGVSGLLRSFEISPQRLNRTQKRYGTGLLPVNWDSFYTLGNRGAPLDIEDQVIAQIGKVDQTKLEKDLKQLSRPKVLRYCQLLQINPDEFLAQASSSYWEYIPGLSRTIVGDSAIQDRFHILTTQKGGQRGYGYTIFEKGRVVNNAYWSLFSYGEDYALSELVNSYQFFRQIRSDTGCPIIEAQTAGNLVYFLQNHLGVNQSLPGFELNPDQHKGEIEASFVRGATGPVVEEVKLSIYIGVDRTSDSLHLSHAKNYMFLEELRQLGHEVIVLVGDFTARIGDPTDNTSSRVRLSKEQVEINTKSWLRQIKPLMDFETEENPPRILYNSEWLSKMTWEDEIELAANVTVQQLLERDMFKKRLENNMPIYSHEFQYPLMQGYDSVAMDVDVELCGRDQIFNALMGRTLMKRLKNKDKFVVAVNLMENPKTGELMSKSRGTGVFLSSSAVEMFGAIMAQPDEMIEVLFINVTRIPLTEKDKIMKMGPREAKIFVAQDIVKRFYGEAEAQKAREEWENVFSKGELPESMPEYEAGNIIDVIVGSGLAESKTEAKRLIDQNAVQVNNEVVKDWGYEVKSGDIIKVGPRKFLKIK